MIVVPVALEINKRRKSIGGQQTSEVENITL